MALSSNPGFLNQTQDNYANAKLKRELLTGPVISPTTVQSDLPWKYEKIELVDSYVYKTNDTIRFNMPRNGLIDPRSLRLSFNVRGMTSIVTSSAYIGAFVCDINSIFSRCTLKCGSSQVITDMEGYNLFSRTISKMANEYQMQYTHRGMYGGFNLGGSNFSSGNNLNFRLAYHSPGNVGRPQPLSAPRRYLVNINQGLFAQQKPIFMDSFNDQMVLEFVLDKPSVATYYSTASNTYGTPPNPVTISVEVGNPTLHYTIYYPSPQLQAEIMLMARNQQLGYQFHAHDYYRFSIPARLSKHVYHIPISRKWLKYAVAVIRCDKDRDPGHFSGLRTYACVDPNVNTATTSSINLSQKWPKQSAIKQYQWKYGNQCIPNQPVRVLNAVPVFYDASGVPITGASSNLTQRFDYPVTDFPFVSPGVEAWYMVEQLFLRHKELQLQQCNPIIEGVFTPLDPGSQYSGLVSGGTDDSSADSGPSQGTASVNGRVPSHFMMVGLFSETDYEGNMLSMSGGLQNEKLSLHFDTVGISDNPTPETDMFIEIFLGYDNMMQVTENGILLTN